MEITDRVFDTHGGDAFPLIFTGNLLVIRGENVVLFKWALLCPRAHVKLGAIEVGKAGRVDGPP